jgi:hypothetical protein
MNWEIRFAGIVSSMGWLGQPCFFSAVAEVKGSAEDLHQKEDTFVAGLQGHHDFTGKKFGGLLHNIPKL